MGRHESPRDSVGRHVARKRVAGPVEFYPYRSLSGFLAEIHRCDSRRRADNHGYPVAWCREDACKRGIISSGSADHDPRLCPYVRVGHRDYVRGDGQVAARRLLGVVTLIEGPPNIGAAAAYGVSAVVGDEATRR